MTNPEIWTGTMRSVLARDDNDVEIPLAGRMPRGGRGGASERGVLRLGRSPTNCYFNKRKVPRLGRGMMRRVLARDDNGMEISLAGRMPCGGRGGASKRGVLRLGRSPSLRMTECFSKNARSLDSDAG